MFTLAAQPVFTQQNLPHNPGNVIGAFNQYFLRFGKRNIHTFKDNETVMRNLTLSHQNAHIICKRR
jgi:hypothetical protein